MANEFLDTALIRHSIWLQGLATHEAKTFDPFLQKADRIIRNVLSGYGDRIDTVKTMNEIIRQLRVELGANYSEWGEELIGDMQEIADSEAQFTSKTLDKAVVGRDVATPAPAQVWAAINVRPIQINDKGESKLMQALIKGFTPNEVNRVNGVVRNGFYSGATIQDMITAIRGTKKNNFNDGVLVTTRRSAETIARTATNHVSSVARQSTFKANQDVLKGWEFTATLDNRTTTICRFNDGQVHPIGSGPIPPLHLGCRSSAVPVVKDKFDIFGDAGTRASKGADGGKQVRNQSYYDWLSTQPKFFQEEVLGKSQAQLFRKGGLSAEQFRKLTSSKFGQPLTLQEIKAKDADAWRDANLD